MLPAPHQPPEYSPRLGGSGAIRRVRKAFTRQRKWLPGYNEFLTRAVGHVWAFAGPTMPRFLILNLKTIVPRASIIPGHALFLREGASHQLNMPPHKNEVEGQPVYTYTLPKCSRTELQLAMDELDSNLYKLNEIW